MMATKTTKTVSIRQKPISANDSKQRVGVKVGIGDNKRAKVAEALSGLLGSTNTLYQKSRYYHWNVTGENFMSLHLLFEKHYQELHEAGDELAERIRALGCIAPGTSKEFTVLSQVEEDASLPDDWRTMVENLLQSHETCTLQAREVLETAEECEDEVTVDMMVGRMTIHDKTAWMLRSYLGQ